MGAVYEAVDARLDTTVALKETLFTDEKLRKQFEREARLLARLHHPALPRVSDHFNEGDGQFLVMQYIAGEDLSEMLAQRQGPFLQEDVLRWADQLCDALDYLHTQDPEIIHRDIKPQNLKLTARGQIVLLDFGLAKGSAGQMSVVTTSASIFGYTPNYAPLEQVQGLGTDARSDIYSVAATLFHLLTNAKPPDALSRAGALVNGLPDPLPLANRVVPQISAAVANVLSKGMSQKRDDRFASATLMREAIRLASNSRGELSDAETVMATVAGGTSGSNTVASAGSTNAMGQGTQMAGNEAQTRLAGDATKVRGTAAGSEAVTMVRSTNGAKASRAWLGALLLLIVCAVGAGGFYAYRARRRAQQSATTTTQAQTPTQQAEPSQSPVNPVSAPTDSNKAAESKAERKVERSQRSLSARQPAEKKEPATANNSGPGNLPDPGHDAGRNSGRRGDPNFRPLPPRAGEPPFDPLRNPQGRTPGHPPGTGPEIRTLRNGTRVIRQPDGTYVVVMPNGTTRVVTPAQKPNRNPNRNRP